MRWPRNEIGKLPWGWALAGTIVGVAGAAWTGSLMILVVCVVAAVVIGAE